MKTIMHRAIALIQLLLLSSLCVAAGKVHNAGTLNIELKGRGLYQESAVALYSNKVLTMEAPQTGWLNDMQKRHLALLKGINLSDPAKLSRWLSKGIHHRTVPIQVLLQYSTVEGKTVTTQLKITNVHAFSGNMQYDLADPVNLPQEIENVTLLIKTWHAPTRSACAHMEEGASNDESVCCDCSGVCAFYWLMFNYCDTCVSPQGGEHCCQICDKPAAPGQSCP